MGKFLAGIFVAVVIAFLWFTFAHLDQINACKDRVGMSVLHVDENFKLECYVKGE